MSETIVRYLGEVPRQAIWGILLIILAVAVLHPLNLPVGVTDATEGVYNVIEALEPGDIVIWQGSNAFQWLVETAPAGVAVLNHLAMKEGVKLIILPTSSEHAFFAKYCLDLSEYPEKKTYGEDYVILQYLPGGNPAIMSFLDGIQETVITTDWYGTPIEEIPVIDLYHDHNDIDVWIGVGSGAYTMVYYVNQKDPRIACIDLEQAAWFVMFYIYITTGQLKGMTNGMRGGGEYERLIGRSGLGQTGIDTIQLISAFLIVLVVMGNISTALKRRAGEEGA